MKYIRTKDGIYKVLSGPDKNEWYEQENGIICLPEKYILKQADTIGKLCDEFVGIDSQGHYIIHNDKFIEGARIIPLEKVNYYGAIWTNKGLIYVAKMNDKGELELL